MAQEIAFENGRISNFEGLVTLNLTLDRVILHTVVHYSSTSTYMPNVDVHGRTFETGFIMSTLSFDNVFLKTTSKIRVNVVK